MALIYAANDFDYEKAVNALCEMSVSNDYKEYEESEIFFAESTDAIDRKKLESFRRMFFKFSVLRWKKVNLILVPIH